MKFFVYSEFGELLDLALHLKTEGHEVLWHVANPDYQKIGEGLLKAEKDWYAHMGEKYIWVFDGCDNGALEDWLRAKGEWVVNGTKKGDKLENERQLNQEWFKRAGFYQPFSRNFKDIDQTIKFATEWVTKGNGKLILKQNGNAPKSINYKGHFDDGSDLLYHLEEMKKKWNETQFGKFDCDLMEIVTGLEVAASVFFNGKEYLKNKTGKVVGFLNFEEKKEIDGNLGETTGEMGTTFLGVTEDNKLFREIVIKSAVVDVLKKIGHKGVFDINCIKTDKGIVALEPTMRFGIPATSYEFMEGLRTPTGKLLEIMAKGASEPIEIHEGIGMVMVVAAKPYPVEAELSDENTSMGERIWPIQKEKPAKEFTPEQLKHIHFENVFKDGFYKVATKNGYILTVTGRGKTIEATRKTLIQYIKDNLYIAGMKWRTDIGKRVEEYLK